MGNNCPPLKNWPVFQGLTLQFVVRFRFLLKLLSNLEVGNYSRFGLHICRCQLLKALNLFFFKRSRRTIFEPPYFAHCQPLSTRAASAHERELCSPARRRAQRGRTGCRRRANYSSHDAPRLSMSACFSLAATSEGILGYRSCLLAQWNSRVIKFHFLLQYFLCNLNSWSWLQIILLIKSKHWFLSHRNQLVCDLQYCNALFVYLQPR